MLLNRALFTNPKKKKNLMKAILSSVLFLLCANIFAQVDTVCFSSTIPVVYSILAPSEGIPQWTITGGVIVSGQGTNSIQVNWSSASPGAIVNGVSVTLTNTVCPPPVRNVNIFIFKPVFTPTFTVNCPNSSCISLSWPGTLGSWDGDYISEQVFCPPGFSGTFNTQFTGSYFGCPIVANGTIVVNPAPTLSPITW
jgi:hypothetical protein